MSLTELSVKRPATILVFLITLLGLGYIGYSSLGADLLPSINFPLITVSVSYNGASAEEIKKDVVKPIEDAVSGISGLDKIYSTASEGRGQVMVLFTLESDMNTAFIDVQKSVETVSARLPKNADKPVLYKLDTGEMAVLTLTVSGDIPYDELYNKADNVKQRLEKITGVGKVTLQGALKKKLYIKIDKTALEYYSININTVINKIRTANSNIAAGQIKEEKIRETVKVIGEFSNIYDVKNLMIPVKGNTGVRLSEISEIGILPPDPEQIIKFNGKPTIGINIQKQSDANVVKVVSQIKDELELIQKTLSKNIKITIADDTTVFIKAALGEIQRNLGEGILTTAFVLFLFLRSFRSSSIVLISIPTSLVATVFMMYEFNFTLNMMSLMALSLCIGILVDDSIVVLENIQRHLSMGKNPIDAAIEGRKEIGMAAIAITLCDVVVFAPVAFMSGITGQYFKQFGLTVVFATLFSLLVSFTVTPMLASKFLKLSKKSKDDTQPKNKKFSRIHKLTEKLTNKYKDFLLWSLDNRWKIIISILVGIVLSIALIPLGVIRTELLTQSDQSRLMIDIKLSPGSSLTQTDNKVTLIESYLKSLPEVLDFYSSIGSNNDKSKASIIVKLVPKSKRSISQSQVGTNIRTWLMKLPGIDSTVNEAQMGGPPNTGNKPLQVNVLGLDTTVLNEISRTVEEIVKSIPGVIDVDNSSKVRESEIRINVNRVAADDVGITTSDISSVLWTALQGSNAGVYREMNNEYDIIVKFLDNQVKTTQDLDSIIINSPSGTQIPLSQVASIEKSDAQQGISRQDRQDVIKISANLQGVLLGPVRKDLEDKLSKLDLPDQYTISYGGSQEQMNTVFSALIKALLASVILVYLILVILYESFVTPLIRMLSLPVAIIGALVALAITGSSINMMSMIGLIMLDGLASKNGTLLIDYTNTLMKRGLSLKDALVEAGTTRLRPIIMTSFTMIVGMLPVALSLGEGAEIKSSMAILIIGGMTSSTILTPILLPVVYTIVNDLKQRRKLRKQLILQPEEVL